MAIFNYRVWINDADIEELAEEFGIQAQSVRELLFSIFPSQKKFIRENIPRKILRKKLCWGSEEEWTDLENRLKRFFERVQIEVEKGYDVKGTVTILGYFWEYLRVKSPDEQKAISLPYRYTEGWDYWLNPHKYYLKERFKLEVYKKIKEHIKSPEGNDIIL